MEREKSAVVEDANSCYLCEKNKSRPRLDYLTKIPWIFYNGA